MNENTKELKHNYKYKMFRKMMIERAYNWRDIEKITGYTRQNIYHANSKQIELISQIKFERSNSLKLAGTDS